MKRTQNTTSTYTVKQTRTGFVVQPIAAACLLLLAASSLCAQTLTFPSAPPGTGGNLPAPNVILSVDDSGSMNWGILDDNVTPVNATTNPRRMDGLKAALNATFGTASSTVPDGRIRLAWQTMWNNGGSTGAGSLTPGAINAIKPLDATHRNNFLSFVNSLTPNQGTPSHKIMSQADTYMRNTSSNSPWRTVPGGTAAGNQVELACRRSYHIFMTDGAWNIDPSTGVGDMDGTGRTLPDSTVYNITDTQTRAYRDANGGTIGTLADFAFRSWADDLQPNIANAVPPVIKRSGTETVGTTALQEYWNPKNDPATWQHMQTYTIGFGNSASTWNGAPQWSGSTPPVPADNYAGTGYVNLVNGATGAGWQNPMSTTAPRPSELWHMALNGRGKFYPVRPGGNLTAAFADILDNVLADTSQPLTAITANSTTLKAGLLAYQAGYDATSWSGNLLARPLNAAGVIAVTPTWDASITTNQTNAPVANRVVLTYSGTAGVAFKTLTSLSALSQTRLKASSAGADEGATRGQERLDYLRGDHALEQSAASGIFRNRGAGTTNSPKKRLGDIVNSDIWYVGKPNSGYLSTSYRTFRGVTRSNMIYVGANDGMLHGFDADTGVERLAYIPQGVAEGNLRNLTDTSYTHRYFVDGNPYTADVELSTGATSAWKTVLAGSLASGGKGYFLLDVTQPSNFADTNAANLVMADTTATADGDIGHIFTTPVIDDLIPGRSQLIVRLNSEDSGNKKRWAAIFGNGYNSTNQAPVLLIQYLDGAKELVKVSACALPTASPAAGTCTFQGGNGLSTPRLVDLNNDGTMDVAYAGDLKGNVWKFDLTSTTSANWKASFSNKPLFVAKSGAQTQAITTAPLWQPHPEGGIMLTVGTGKNLELADRTSTTTDSVYGLWDNSTWGKDANGIFKILTESTPINSAAATSQPASLVQQTFEGTTLIDSGNTYYKQSSNAVPYVGASAKRGYYYNWPNAGERVLQNPKIFAGQKVEIQSTIPSGNANAAAESCTPTLSSDRRFFTVNNGFSGAPSAQPVFALSATTVTGASSVTTRELAPGEKLVMDSPNGTEKTIINNCPIGTTCAANTTLKLGKFTPNRANWRQVQ